MDFNLGANNNNEFRDWVAYGYDGLISVGDLIEGQTGAYSNSIRRELASIRGQSFAIPVFSRVEGNGANALFEIQSFLGMTLIDFLLTGPQADRYIELQFDRITVEGPCCASGPDTGVRTVLICAVDPDFDPADCSG